MKRRLALLLLGSLTFSTALAQADFFFELGPSEVLYPPRASTLRFDHALHRAESKAPLDCRSCHAMSEPAPERTDPHESCRGCHPGWIDTDTQCLKCHDELTKGATVARAPPPRQTFVRFEHSVHLRGEDDCRTCHGQVEARGRASRLDFPTMDRCLDCHIRRRAPTTCGTCHFVQRDGTLVQSFPTGTLVPLRFPLEVIHDANFLADHALPARRERAVCAVCHTQPQCLKCHDGIGRNAAYHPDPWMSQHALRARQNQNRCQSCHVVQQFCLRCHQQSGVATFGMLAQPFERRTIRRVNPTQPDSLATGPHPMAMQGWLDPRSRNFHGFHAQRNLRTCAACHQEQFCIVCHGSGFGGRNGSNPAANPHGPNPGRLRSLPAARQNARACLKCHSPADPRWRPQPGR